MVFNWLILYGIVDNTKIYYYFKDICAWLWIWTLLTFIWVKLHEVYYRGLWQENFGAKLHRRTSWGVEFQSLENITSRKPLKVVKLIFLIPVKLDDRQEQDLEDRQAYLVDFYFMKFHFYPYVNYLQIFIFYKLLGGVVLGYKETLSFLFLNFP